MVIMDSLDDIEQSNSKTARTAYEHKDGAETENKKPKRIRFNQQDQIQYLSKAELLMKLENKRNIWYLRKDLVELRKQERDRLIIELRALVDIANETVSSTTLVHDDSYIHSNRNLESQSQDDQSEDDSLQSCIPGCTPSTTPIVASPQSPPPPPPPPILDEKTISDPFCFRGLEVILNKQERDEARKRAIQAVLDEQDRQRNKENREIEAGNHLIHCYGPSLDCIYDSPKAIHQQQISDTYKLMSHNSFDNAYLRGLMDAKEARAILQESLLYPSVLGLNQEIDRPNSSPSAPSAGGAIDVRDNQEKIREKLHDLFSVKGQASAVSGGLFDSSICVNENSKKSEQPRATLRQVPLSPITQKAEIPMKEGRWTCWT